ncbi:MAG: transporter [Rhodospirillales bacterium]
MYGRFRIDAPSAVLAAAFAVLPLVPAAGHEHAAGEEPAAADEIVTRAGDRLTGRILAVGCDGLDVSYLNGQRLRVPLDAVATATTTTSVPVPLQTGDRISGRLSIQAGTVRIDSPVLGVVTLQGSSLARLPVSGSKGGVACTATAAVASRKAAPAITGDKGLAAVTGTGTGTDAAMIGQAEPSLPAPSAPAATTAASSAVAAGGEPAAEASAGPDAAAEAKPLQFLRADAVLLQPYKLEGDLVLSYLRNDQTVQNDKVASIIPAIRFGLIEDMEGFVQLPYSWGRRELNTFNGVERNDADGIGDLRFGLKYSLVPQSATFPNIIGSLSASAPTGETPYLKPPPGAPATGLARDIRDPFAVQLGSGHWSISPGLTAIKSFDPLILFAGVNYTHFFPEEYYGVDVEPGDLYDVNGGLGFAVNDSGTISGQVFAGYQEEWVFNGTHVAETSVSPISLRLAYTHILSPRNLIEPSVLFGLSGDATDALLSLAYSHSF